MRQSGEKKAGEHDVCKISALNRPIMTTMAFTGASPHRFVVELMLHEPPANAAALKSFLSDAQEQQMKREE